MTVQFWSLGFGGCFLSIWIVPETSLLTADWMFSINARHSISAQFLSLSHTTMVIIPWTSMRFQKFRLWINIKCITDLIMYFVISIKIDPVPGFWKVYEIYLLCFVIYNISLYLIKEDGCISQRLQMLIWFSCKIQFVINFFPIKSIW